MKATDPIWCHLSNEYIALGHHTVDVYRQGMTKWQAVAMHTLG